MILAVDDEEDILDTIAEALETATVDRAQDFKTAVKKIAEKQYDLAILDIMGVDGLTLLDKTVEKGIPTVMLTAHALNPETLSGLRSQRCHLLSAQRKTGGDRPDPRTNFLPPRVRRTDLETALRKTGRLL